MFRSSQNLHQQKTCTSYLDMQVVSWRSQSHHGETTLENVSILLILQKWEMGECLWFAWTIQLWQGRSYMLTSLISRGGRSIGMARGRSRGWLKEIRGTVTGCLEVKESGWQGRKWAEYSLILWETLCRDLLGEQKRTLSFVSRPRLNEKRSSLRRTQVRC